MSCLIVSNRHITNATYFENPHALGNHLQAHPEIDTLLFAFWSWIVPTHLLQQYKVYGMHTGPLLEGRGRGGSPIDNLKKLGVEITTLCAFEMTEKIDGGRVRVAIPINITPDKNYIITQIDFWIPRIMDYLIQPYEHIPETFKRIQNVQ